LLPAIKANPDVHLTAANRDSYQTKTTVNTSRPRAYTLYIHSTQEHSALCSIASAGTPSRTKKEIEAISGALIGYASCLITAYPLGMF